MMNGAYNLEIHNPEAASGSLLAHYERLTGAKAAELMTRHADKALLLRECGDPTADDHAALRSFQIRTGKRLVRF